MTRALDILTVSQVVGQYPRTTVAEINSAIEAGLLRARDVSSKPEVKHAYRLVRQDVEAWIADLCPTDAAA